MLIIENLKKALNNLIGDPINIIFNNPYSEIALALGAICGLLADQFGDGYYLVLLGVLLLILVGIWQESRKYEVYKHETLPLPIVINIANPASSKNALKSLFQIIEKDPKYRNYRDNLSKYLKILDTDLVFNYSGDIYKKDMLKAFLQITRYNIEKLKSKIPKHNLIYLVYIGPISGGILVGTMFGTDGVKVFQYNKSSDSYYPIVNITDRKIKEDIKVFEKFEKTVYEKGRDKVTIAIDAASHKINLQDPTIQDYGDIIHLKTKTLGTIERKEDWLQYSREIFKTLNIAQQHDYQEIKLVYSMPIALGVLVGMATGQYWSILLTNYEKETNTYENVMKLNEFYYYTGQ